MNCDIVIYINGEKYDTIKKEESSLELSSLNDVALFIINNWDIPRNNKFLNTLYKSPRVINNEKIYKGKDFIGNTTLEYIKYTYPSVDEILKDVPYKDYNIVLLDKAYASGVALRGRVIGNGKESYIIRNEFDAKNFALTLRIKFEISKVIDNNNIKDDYLNKKYKENLLELKNIYSKQIKEHLKELNPEFKEDITIYDLLNDFLDYKSDYNKPVKIKKTKTSSEKYIDGYSTLLNFCRELLKQQIFNEDSETPIARRFRAINYKREKIGKQDFYDTIILLGNEDLKTLLQNIPPDEFINLSLNDLLSLFQELFKYDPILSRYKVHNVETTLHKKTTLKSNQISKLIKNQNSLLPKEKLVSEESLKTIKGILLFFSDNIEYVDKNGQTHHIILEEIDGKIIWKYYSKELDNDYNIFLEREGRNLRDELNFGNNTIQQIIPVNDSSDGEVITNGKYKSYYIHQFLPNDKLTIYIVSKSRIHLNSYDLPKFSSLRDAKLAVQGFIRSANINDELDIEIKKYIQKSDQKTRSVFLSHPIVQGLTITSRYFPIKGNTKLNNLELNLINNYKIKDIQEFYKQFGIDLTSLTTAEDIGIFLYAMVEAGLTIETLEKQLQNSSLEAESDEYVPIYKSIQEANKIINSIENAPFRDYLVERWSVKKDKNNKTIGYIAFLKSTRNLEINSLGLIPKKGNIPAEVYVRSKSLEDLQSHLNNTLFKNSKIKIKIINKIEAELLKTQEGEYVFPDKDFINKVKGFIFDDNIYIISDNADLKDLIHETLHIVLGSIKVKDSNIYRNIINYYYNNSASAYKDYVNKNYANLQKFDRMEEVVVRSLASSINNSVQFFDTQQLNNISLLLIPDFSKSTREILKIIAGSNGATDLNFTTIIDEMLKDDDSISKMKKNRLITNAIKKGIENGSILRSSEDC